MDEAKVHEIWQWLIKAKHDIGSAKRLAAGEEPFFDTAVYHCQQAVEKALKAYLTLKDTPFQKVHDLSALIEQCIPFDSTFDGLRNVAEVLTPYATAFRYPGDVLEPDPSDVAEAIRMAEYVIDFIYQRMPAEVKNSMKS